MKILLLANPELDYLEMNIFTGFCDLIGSENVVTLPYKYSYYGKVDTSYTLPDGKIGMTAPASQMVAREENKWSYEEIISRITEFDFIILGSHRQYAIEYLDKLIKDFDGSSPLPVIYCDGEDGANIHFEVIDKYKDIVLMFKRDSIKENEYNNIFPCPFSCNIESFPKFDDTQKKYDIFSVFGMTWPLRLQLTEKLFELGYQDNSIIGIDTKAIREDFKPFNSKLFGYNEYLEKIAQSKIAISIRGNGYDTVRHWEICAYNTLMLICDHGITIPNDFEDKKHCIYFKKDLSDLKDKIDYYLKNDKEREEIAKNGREHLLKYHTSKKRAEYMLGIIKKKIGGLNG